MVGNAVSDVDLDETDLRIIGLLQKDGRRSNSGIGRELGLPESTVRRRIERLRRDDFIKIVAIANHERMGLPVHVIMGLSLDLARNATATRALVNLIQVGWLAATTGPYDILLEASFPSMRHLHEFITKELAQIEGVERVETAIVLDLAKHTFDWLAFLRADQCTMDAFRISIGLGAQDEGNPAWSTS
ncbi:MAG: Lrp/AsnC family transcriptional regulator [Chloroflexota bacterium]|nr:Lrp/AsnC family transcriptional regulator [Chloroflexota bacterium]